MNEDVKSEIVKEMQELPASEVPALLERVNKELWEAEAFNATSPRAERLALQVEILVSRWDGTQYI